MSMSAKSRREIILTVQDLISDLISPSNHVWDEFEESVDITFCFTHLDPELLCERILFTSIREPKDNCFRSNSLVLGEVGTEESLSHLRVNIPSISEKPSKVGISRFARHNSELGSFVVCLDKCPPFTWYEHPTHC